MRTLSPTTRTEDLPEIMTASELAAFERVDVRTLRAQLDAGQVPGAFRRGRQWRIVRDVYLETVAGR